MFVKKTVFFGWHLLVSEFLRHVAIFYLLRTYFTDFLAPSPCFFYLIFCIYYYYHFFNVKIKLVKFLTEKFMCKIISGILFEYLCILKKINSISINPRACTTSAFVWL